MNTRDPKAAATVKPLPLSLIGFGSPYERHRKMRVRRPKKDAKARARSRRRAQRDSRRKNRGQR